MTLKQGASIAARMERRAWVRAEFKPVNFGLFTPSAASEGVFGVLGAASVFDGDGDVHMEVLGALAVEALLPYLSSQLCWQSVEMVKGGRCFGHLAK